MIQTHQNYAGYAPYDAQRRERVGVVAWNRVAFGNILLLAAAVLCIAGYLVMNNRAAEKAFSIRTEEQRIAELKDKKQALDLAIVTAQSMGAIDASVEGLGLVPVADVEYVNVGGSVAVK